jgi:hypothetical protein
MQPSPSLGPPALSASWSPPPCGIHPVGDGAGFGLGLEVVTTGLGAGAGLTCWVVVGELVRTGAGVLV